jgi:hypothetical protein
VATGIQCTRSPVRFVDLLGEAETGRDRAAESASMPANRIVSIDELSQYLHLPEKAVAKELGICLTSLKKLCRQNGITRWPYRKLKSLDKKIARAENVNSAGETEDAATLKARAEELKKEYMAVALTYGIKTDRGSRKDPEKGGREEEEVSTPDTCPPPDLSMLDVLSVDGMPAGDGTRTACNKPEIQGESEGEDCSKLKSSFPSRPSIPVKSAPLVSFICAFFS